MRTTKQNSSYWLLICEKSAEFYTDNNAKFIADLYKSLLAHLPPEYEAMIERLSQIVKLQIDKDLVHELFKRLFNNGQSTRFDDTTEKGTKKMIEYETKIRAHMASYGCDLPEANEISPIEFIGV